MKRKHVSSSGWMRPWPTRWKRSNSIAIAISGFAPHAQGEKAARLVKVVVVDPVSGPCQDFGPVCMHSDFVKWGDATPLRRSRFPPSLRLNSAPHSD